MSPTITGPRNNYREGRGVVIIPIVSTTYCKIIITDDNGVNYTVMNTYSGDRYTVGNEFTWYRFTDEDFLDSSGNNYNGTQTGSPTFVTGKYGLGLSQNNSSNDGFYVPALGDNFGSGMSISMWLKTGTTDTSRQRLWSSSNFLTAYFESTNGNLVFYIYNGTSAGSSTGVTNYILRDNSWHLYTVTMSDNVVKFYRDGSLIQESLDDNPIQSNMTSAFYFAQNSSGTESVTGVIDDCRIFNTVISEEDIGNLYSYDSNINTQNFAISGEVTLVTEGIGNFNLTLVNDNGRFYQKFDGGEEVKIYMDDVDASTLIFHGRIDNVSYGLNNSNGFFVDIDGREKPEFVDKTITGIQIAATADSALADIFYNNYPDVLLQFWNGSKWITGTYNTTTRLVSWSGDASTFPTTLVNLSYQNRKGISIISDILNRANLDGYIYYDEDENQTYFRCFIKESINNSMAIAYGVNLLSVNNYGIDNNEIYNKIIAYGKQESDNIILLKTVQDEASQSELWVKDKIVEDSDSDTMTAISDKATAELSKSLVVTPGGSFTGISLSSIRPGEMIHISIPYITDDLHKVTKLTHNISDFISTTVEVTKKNTVIGDLFLQKFNPDEVTGISNINDMRDSYTVYFDDDENVMNHSSTEEADGRLKLIDGVLSGTATSAIVVTDYDVTSCELRKYENYATGLDVYRVTNDGGNTWEDVTIDGTVHTFATPGREIGFQIEMNRTFTTDPTPMYESICLLYK